ncbi:alpha/beta hydrolase [Gemmatimonadetes bacterium T265]|nr:alpha/beta hydrolase [Gemmatimonadetes bacterium T265]
MQVAAHRARRPRTQERTMTTSRTIRLDGALLHVTLDRKGEGRPLLLLHGGAGPASMRPLFGALENFELILPTHPGFDGTERPAWMDSVADLADCYVALLAELALQDVLLVGNSVGGWIAAEMAARQPPSLAGIIAVDTVGLQPTERTGPIVDPRSLPPEELAKRSFANPAMARPPSPEAAALRQANQQVLMAYAGEPYMHDPTLSERLSRISVPSLVLWGSHDRVVTPEYGREFARQIPHARFQLIDDAGHLPQIERPEQTAQAIRDFSHTVA